VCGVVTSEPPCIPCTRDTECDPLGRCGGHTHGGGREVRADPGGALTEVAPAQHLVGDRRRVEVADHDLFARATVDGEDRGVTCFLVPQDAAGYTGSKIHGKLGLRAGDTAEIVLDGVQVGADDVLGEVGGGMKVALSALDDGRFSLASGAVGLAREALEVSLRYAEERDQWGGPIAGKQLVQELLAAMHVDVQAASGLVDRVVDMIAEAEKPVVLAGRGVIRSGARQALEALAEQSGALLATSLLGKGLFDGNPWALDIAGSFASDFARELCHVRGLFARDRIRAQCNGWHAQGVEADHVIRAFDENEPQARQL
jgi:alkylation response protein AidB-like acyl-CoA dehydrogenase